MANSTGRTPPAINSIIHSSFHDVAAIMAPVASERHVASASQATEERTLDRAIISADNTTVGKKNTDHIPKIANHVTALLGNAGSSGARAATMALAMHIMVA